MRVLLVLDHAPDYREEFLRQLSCSCSLTVIAQPCEPDGLMPPSERIGYRYIESNTSSIGPFRWFCGFSKLLARDWDTICVAFNPHHPWRLLPFLLRRSYRKKWVWWGQVYGKSNSKVLSSIRQYFLGSSRAVLVYSKEIQDRLTKELPGISIKSFNNTQASLSDYKRLPFRSNGDGLVRLLFVGRPQDRKRLHVLVNLARERSDVRIRLVGPVMQQYMRNTSLGNIPGVDCFDGAKGDALLSHFEWCDLVANPGHLGLLAVNAAQHFRPIAVQNNVVHAPEVILAREANQVFLNFDNAQEIDSLIQKIKSAGWLQDKAESLHLIGRHRYTIENMVQVHIDLFSSLSGHE